VHFVERIRTFHGQWFADLCVRVLEQAKVARKGDTVDELRAQGLWREALAMASKQEPTAATWLQKARLQRLLRQPEQALDSVKKARALATPTPPANVSDDGHNDRRQAQPDQASCVCSATRHAKRGSYSPWLGKLLDAQPVLEQAWRSTGERAAEAGYWYALNALRLGDESARCGASSSWPARAATRVFGRRARANATLGPMTGRSAPRSRASSR
jgi:hypothetical protein